MRRVAFAFPSCLLLTCEAAWITGALAIADPEGMGVAPEKCRGFFVKL